MGNTAAIQLSEAQRHEVASWIATHQESFPEAVRIFLAAHEKYLSAGVNIGRRFEETYRELRRALGIVASSERRRGGEAERRRGGEAEKRRSGVPLATVPRGGDQSWAGNEEQRLMAQRDRSLHLGLWHDDLTNRHTQRGQRIKEKLEKMKRDQTEQAKEGPSAEEPAVIEDTRVEDIELTPEQEAANEVRAEECVEHLEEGDGADPELKSVNEAPEFRPR